MFLEDKRLERKRAEIGKIKACFVYLHLNWQVRCGGAPGASQSSEPGVGCEKRELVRSDNIF